MSPKYITTKCHTNANFAESDLMIKEVSWYGVISTIGKGQYKCGHVHNGTNVGVFDS